MYTYSAQTIIVINSFFIKAGAPIGKLLSSLNEDITQLKHFRTDGIHKKCTYCLENEKVILICFLLNSKCDFEQEIFQ